MGRHAAWGVGYGVGSWSLRAAWWRWAALCVAGWLAVPAWGQFPSAMPLGWTDPPVTRRELRSYAQILSLTPEQMEMARDLVEGNRAAHKAFGQRLDGERQQLVDKGRDSGDWSKYREGVKRINADRVKLAEENEATFFSDFGALLTAEQEAAFARVAHKRQRDTLMRYALVTGMGDDPFDVLEAIKAPPDAYAAVKSDLERYEEQVHEQLVNLEKKIRELSLRYAADPNSFSGEKLVEEYKPLEQIGRKVRDLNREAARVLATVLSAEQQAAYEEECRRRAFPRLARESQAQKTLRAALKVETLEGPNKDALVDFAASYERKRGEADAALRKLLTEQEEKAGGRLTFATRGGWWWNGETRSRYDELQKAKKDLDEQVWTKIEKLLDEKQRAQLPTRTPEPKGDGERLQEWGWSGLGVDEDEAGKGP